MNIVRGAQIVMETWCALFCLLAAFTVDYGKKAEVQENVELGYMLAINTILLIADSLDILFRGESGLGGRIMVYVSNNIVFFCMYLLAFMSSKYVLTLLKRRDVEVSPMFLKVANAIFAGSVILLVLNIFFGFLFYIDSDNFYHRGQWWIVSQIPGALVMAMCLIVAIVFSKRFTLFEGLALMSYFFIPMLAQVAQTFIYGFCIMNLAVTMSLMWMFLVYERSRTDKIMQQAKEIVEQEKARNDWELSTLRAQVQPHFIFNCMTTIQALCRKDPKLAAEAIEKFSRFLRCTIDAYDKKECVSWDDEMFIVNNFLFLEKTRFGAWLDIKKDIEAEGFYLPALSVQALIENSIIHGLKPKPEGGTIYLYTLKNKDEYQIIVEDDGVGFDPEEVKNDGKNHIGIKNVGNRLKYMCNGRLDIESEKGKGTRMTIHIPKQDNIPEE